MELKDSLHILNNQQQILKFEDLQDDNRSGFNACIGQTASQNNIYIDFKKTPHVLIGGSSGSGKSCLVNCIIKSLMQKYNDFYMSIIDIKQVEFLQYKEAEQLATPIVTTVSRCYELLENYIAIMNNRYTLLSQKGYKNIDEYNSEEDLTMYRHVIVIDELANILLDNKLIIKPLQKLLQLRARRWYSFNTCYTSAQL